MTQLLHGRMSRRRFLSTGIGVAAGIALGLLASLSALAESASRTARSGPGGQLRALRLTVAEGEVDLGVGEIYRTWLYNGAFPGTELRVREGGRLRIAVQNQAPGATRCAGMGCQCPTRPTVCPGCRRQPSHRDSFLYEFDATPAGSYMYHSHVGLQIDRGLVGPLIIEERTATSPTTASTRSCSTTICRRRLLRWTRSLSAARAGAAG